MACIRPNPGCVRPGTGRFTKFGVPSAIDSTRLVLDLANGGLEPTRNWLASTNFGVGSTKSGPSRPTLVFVRPNVRQVCVNSPNLGLRWTNLGSMWPGQGFTRLHRPRTDQIWTVIVVVGTMARTSRTSHLGRVSFAVASQTRVHASRPRSPPIRRHHVGMPV